MKKKITILLILLMSLCLTGCGKSYKGYWCKYDEISQIVVHLDDNYKSSHQTKIEAKIETFENVVSIVHYTKEDYAAQLGEDASNLDIYDSYVINLSSMDHIGTYIEDLEKMNGVHEAIQSRAKTNISLFNIQSWGKYTFTNSDEATESDLETGKFKEKKGVLTFTPKNGKGEQKLLYIKDDYLCGDANCNQIYARSNSTCTTD